MLGGMKRYSTDELRSMDRAHVWHPFTHMKLWMEEEEAPVIVGAEGMELIDSDGRRYLDGVSSLWCNVHGHRVPEIDAAIREQLDRVGHSTMLGLGSEAAIVLADRLMKIVPANLKKVFYSDAGATAAEIAFKLAVQYWHNLGRGGKCEFVGLSEAYHGDTTGAMSVGRTAAFHRPYFPMLFKVHFAPTPFEYGEESRIQNSEFGIQNTEYRIQNTEFRIQNAESRIQNPESGIGNRKSVIRDRCLKEMERILSAHHSTIAAVCVEPVVQGAAGMIVQPEGYLRGVRALCDKYEVLLICDEVATGFGRTGRMFACEHEGVQPDLMCVAKGITGGYLPLAATFATQEIFDAFLGEPWEGRTFFHGHTYTGNPLACAAALASLELFEKNDLLKQADRRGGVLGEMLLELMELPCVGEIRRKGLMVGIELVEDRGMRKRFDPKRRVGAEVCRRLRDHGIILRPLGDVIVMMPPLAMGEGDLGRIAEGLKIELARVGKATR